MEQGGWVNYSYPYGSTGGGEYLIHHGVDLAGEKGTPVLAVADGKVVVAGDDHTTAYGPTTDFYGLLVVIELKQRYRGQPIFCLYGHLSEVLVEEGQEVKRGDIIGRVGSTGIALGDHLHFEVRLGENTYNATRNPMLWLEPLPKRGTIAGLILDVDGNPVNESLVSFHRMEAPEEEWRETWTYVNAPGINPDEEWGENFVLADVPPGEYLMEVKIGPHTYKRKIVVESGKTSFIKLRAVD